MKPMIHKSRDLKDLQTVWNDSTWELPKFLMGLKDSKQLKEPTKQTKAKQINP